MALIVTFWRVDMGARAGSVDLLGPLRTRRRAASRWRWKLAAWIRHSGWGRWTGSEAGTRTLQGCQLNSGRQ